MMAFDWVQLGQTFGVPVAVMAYLLWRESKVRQETALERRQLYDLIDRNTEAMRDLKDALTR